MFLGHLAVTQLSAPAACRHTVSPDLLVFGENQDICILINVGNFFSFLKT